MGERTVLEQACRSEDLPAAVRFEGGGRTREPKGRVA